MTHRVVAAASSDSITRAEDFLKEINAPHGAKAYGCYQDLVNDPDCDIIYIATPHSHHFQHAMLCLHAGKNVLCEKPFTVNAGQAELLIETARSKSLFLMEAMWTRYLPLSLEIEKLVASTKLGKLHRVLADVSFGDNVEQTWDPEHRMVNMSLAGGALLDCTLNLLEAISDLIDHSGWIFPVLGFSNVIPSTRCSTRVSWCEVLYDKVSTYRRR